MKITRTLARLAAIGAIGTVGAVGLAPSAEAATVVSTLYQFANHSGTSLNVTHANNGFVCTSPTDDYEAWASYPDSITWFMNDNTSSFRSFATCWTKLWEHNNWTGASYGFTSSATSLIGTGMDNRASSVDAS